MALKGLAKRLDQIPPYLFAEIDRKKAEAIARGVDIIDLSIGDPDLPTPLPIVRSLQKVAGRPESQGYPPYTGLPAFRKAIAEWYRRRFRVTLDPQKEVLALIGSKEGIAHLPLGLIDPGDVVLVPDPGYPVYKISTLMAGGVPYSIPLTMARKFLPNLSAIPTAVAKKAKLMFVNYPNNPTAAIAPKSFYQDLVAFAREFGIALCSDLAYSEIAFDSHRPLSLLQIPGAKDVTIECHSLSKTYNMTGWRVGMAAGNSELIRALSLIKMNIDSGIFKAIQTAAIGALTGNQSHIPKMNKIYARRRDVIIGGLNSLGWKLEKPKASFYIWVPVPSEFTSVAFAAYLLEKAGVLVVPGSGYGEYGDGYIRIAITCPENRMKEAIQRLTKEKIRYR